MLEPPTVHLLCGLPASGKTELAKRLAAEHQAVRFTLDEWMSRLFAIGPYDEDYGAKADRCRELIWDVAMQVLGARVDVVLDWSQWSRSRRAAMADRAASVGAGVLVHFLDVPLDEAVVRVRNRNQHLQPGIHLIDPDEMRRFAESYFEPPDPSEGLPLTFEP